MCEGVFREVRTGDLKKIENSIDKKNINSINDSGISLLHESIASRHDDISLYLISNGIDTNIPNKEGKSAIAYAAIYQNSKITEAIIKKGTEINSEDSHGNTPLWHALLSSRGDYSVFILIFNAGGDPYIVNKYGRSVSSFSKQSGNIEAMKILGIG